MKQFRRHCFIYIYIYTSLFRRQYDSHQSINESINESINQYRKCLHRDAARTVQIKKQTNNLRQQNNKTSNNTRKT